MVTLDGHREVRPFGKTRLELRHHVCPCGGLLLPHADYAVPGLDAGRLGDGTLLYGAKHGRGVDGAHAPDHEDANHQEEGQKHVDRGARHEHGQTLARKKVLCGEPEVAGLTGSRGAGEREVVTAVVLGEAAAVPGQGLEGGGPGLLAGLLAELGVVVGTDGAPVGERGHEAVDALLIAAELCGRPRA